MFRKICTALKNINTKQNADFNQLNKLRGNSLFETFLNVKAFNKLNEVKRDIRAIKRSKKKYPDGNKIRQSLFEEIKNAQSLPREQMKQEAERISTQAYREKLKQKIGRGKKLSKINVRSLKNTKFRNGMNFLKKSSFIVPIMLCANKDDITSAYNDLGLTAAVEEADKSSFMGIMGLSIVKYTSRQCRNISATAAIYTPIAGRLVKGSGIIGGIMAGIGIKKGFDLLWQTEYEKSKTRTEQNQENMI